MTRTLRYLFDEVMPFPGYQIMAYGSVDVNYEPDGSYELGGLFLAPDDYLSEHIPCPDHHPVRGGIMTALGSRLHTVHIEDDVRTAIKNDEQEARDAAAEFRAEMRRDDAA